MSNETPLTMAQLEALVDLQRGDHCPVDGCPEDAFHAEFALVHLDAARQPTVDVEALRRGVDPYAGVIDAAFQEGWDAALDEVATALAESQP